MTTREQLSELNSRLRFRAQKIQEHRDEILHHERLIEHHQKATKDIVAQKQHFYRDSGMEPYALMAPAERMKIDKMPIAEEQCEFCEANEVKKGKKSICIRCGHEQTKEAK